ncbi:MAG: hypothetical protein JO038_03525 [Alphaproteobacteria bacterium]|nr:hypothetical protein [Alphaproteobacteria bacterium]
MLKYLAPIFAAVMLFYSAAPASSQGMSYSYSHWYWGRYWGNGPWWETPAQNVWRSQRYDRRLQYNLSFRAYRMRKECGPIGDPQLHASCIASFDYFEPVLPGAHYGYWGWRRWHRGHHWHRWHR